MKSGMGWIGWTEQQTLDTSMPAIELARKGREEMILQVIKAALPAFGIEMEASPVEEEAEPISQEKLRDVLRALAG